MFPNTQPIFNFGVEEKHPLKQGLKLFFSIGYPIAVSVEEEHPLKQGLKL